MADLHVHQNQLENQTHNTREIFLENLNQREQVTDSQLPNDLRRYLQDLQNDENVPDTPQPAATDLTEPEKQGKTPAVYDKSIWDRDKPWLRCNPEPAPPCTGENCTEEKPEEVDMTSCVTEAINNNKDEESQCEYVREHCESDSLINFNTFHYCTLQYAFGYEVKKWVFWPICGFMLYAFMYNLGSTADEYLSPALEHMTVSFGIPESLAGVTLLAFGNGAPDVFASIASATSSDATNQDKYYSGDAIQAVTPLLGSSLFITSAVIPLALRAAENGTIAVTPSFFVRDIFFFVLVYLYLLTIFFTIGYLNFYVSFGFLMIYIIYVIIVVVQARMDNKETDQDIDDANLNFDAQDFLRAATRLKGPGGSKHVKISEVQHEFKRQAGRAQANLEMSDDEDETKIEVLDDNKLNLPGQTKGYGLNDSINDGNESDQMDSLSKSLVDGTRASQGAPSVFVKGGNTERATQIQDDHVSVIHNEKVRQSALQRKGTVVADAPDRLFIAQKLRNMFKRSSDEDDSGGVVDCFTKIVSVPLNFIRDYTVPMGEIDAWDRNRAAITLITMPISFFTLMGWIDGDNLTLLWAGLGWMPVGFILALVVRFRVKERDPPSWLMTLYSVLAFIMSIGWINMTSDWVVSMLKLFGYVTSIPFPLLQLTILAWGNCLGDMSADVAMTKKGFGEMAITATVAGPVFNTLIGMSLSNFASYALNANPGANGERTEQHIAAGFLESQLKFYFRELIPTDQRYKYGIPPEGLNMKGEPDASSLGNYGCFDKNAMVPIIIMGSQLGVVGLVFFNGISNKFQLSYRFQIISLVLYFSTLGVLIWYSLSNNLKFED